MAGANTLALICCITNVTLIIQVRVKQSSDAAMLILTLKNQACHTHTYTHTAHKESTEINFVIKTWPENTDIHTHTHPLRHQKQPENADIHTQRLRVMAKHLTITSAESVEHFLKRALLLPWRRGVIVFDLSYHAGFGCSTVILYEKKKIQCVLCGLIYPYVYE